MRLKLCPFYEAIAVIAMIVMGRMRRGKSEAKHTAKSYYTDDIDTYAYEGREKQSSIIEANVQYRSCSQRSWGHIYLCITNF